MPIYLIHQLDNRVDVANHPQLLLARTAAALDVLQQVSLDVLGLAMEVRLPLCLFWQDALLP
jgi:hypothetical protein